MIKRLALVLAFAAGLISHVQAAGTVPGFSLQRMISSTGVPLVNCYLYVIQAGTTSTAQNAYQDSGLSIAQPNPMRCDGNGWLPQFFVADGSIKLRLTDSNGNQQIVADNILVVGPSGGGGGGSSVDPTTVLQTGHMELFYGTGPLTGFVRCNGRTIGSATSGATERANADTQSLFDYLWAADSNLSVSGGRGASAAADWSANKTLTLPDCRGRAIAGLDDMGSSAASRLTSSWFGATATTLGAVGGNEKSALSSTNQLPQFTPSVSGFSINVPQQGFAQTGSAVGNAFSEGSNNGGLGSLAVTSGTITISAIGSASPSSFAAIGPRILMTIYIKL